MKIVDFWKNQVEIWNNEEKCGFCWNFSAPLTESAMNVLQLRDEKECCVNAFLTDIWYNGVYEYRVPPFQSLERCQVGFTLWAVLPTNLGENNYDEIQHHSIDQSRWEKIFEPLLNCLSCQMVLDECLANGNLFEVVRWRMDTVHNFNDMNYTGWKITAIFQERN